MPVDIPFHKMHGIGNDFVVIAEDVFSQIPLVTQPDTVRQLCDRHFGIGADGVLTYTPLPDGLKFCIFNADGSRDTMCGNGLRCVISLLAEQGRIPVSGIAKTDSGDVHYIYHNAESISLELPPPDFFHGPINVDGYCFFIINTGSPHAVTLLTGQTGPDDSVFKDISCGIESHLDFPSGISANWVWKAADGSLHLRTWERGVGETLGCGTGACAAGVAYLTENPGAGSVALTSNGGTLSVAWAGGAADTILLTGPATHVMSGVIRITNIADASPTGV
jgi:diaminopimelate epimerase